MPEMTDAKTNKVNMTNKIKSDRDPVVGCMIGLAYFNTLEEMLQSKRPYAAHLILQEGRNGHPEQIAVAYGTTNREAADALLSLVAASPELDEHYDRSKLTALIEKVAKQAVKDDLI